MKKSYDKRTGSALPYIFTLMFLAGVAFGAATAFFHPGEIKFVPSGSEMISVFLTSFKSFLKPCMIIWVSGFTGISLYLSSFALAYRGGVFGFVICSVYKTFGFPGGILKALLISLPQNIIYFPSLLFLALAASCFKRKKSAGYILMLALSIIICATSALIDACITSNLINFTF